MQSAYEPKKYKNAAELGAALSEFYLGIQNSDVECVNKMTTLLKNNDDKLIYHAIKSLPIKMQKALLKAMAVESSVNESAPLYSHYKNKNYNLLFGTDYKDKARERGKKLEKLQACTTDTMSSDDYRKRGEYYLIRSNFVKAIRDLNTAISKNPEDFLARTLLVYTYLHKPATLGNSSTKMAMTECESAIELITNKINSADKNRDYLQSHYRMRAELFALKGDLHSAIHDRLKLLELLESPYARAQIMAKVSAGFKSLKQPPESLLYCVKACNEDQNLIPTLLTSIASMTQEDIFNLISKLGPADQFYLYNECLKPESMLGKQIREHALKDSDDISAIIQEKLDRIKIDSTPLSVDDFVLLNADESDNETDQDTNSVRLGDYNK